MIDSRIPLMTQAIDMNAMLENGSKQTELFTKMRTDGELARIYREAGGDLGKMAELGKQSKYAQLVMPNIQSQAAAQEKAMYDQLKTEADIAKTSSEAYKNNQQGGGYALENSGKKLGAINGAIQQVALTGDKTQALLALHGANRAGAITPEDLEYQSKIINAMTPDELKRYASGIVFSNSKDPSSIMYQSANNVADNAQSDINNQRTTNASIYSTDVSAETADKNRAQSQSQFEQNYALNQQKAFFEQNKPIGFEVGNDGFKYAIYPNGKGIRVLGDDGQPIKVQQKSGNLTAQNAQREEAQRISKVDAILDEIGGVKDKDGVRDGGVLSKATNSYLGRGLDYFARGLGFATDGDAATAELGTLGGQLVALMPKMSGPQSDKDVAMYKQMAGKLDDPTLPYKVRKSALDAIDNLNQKYAKMNQQSSVQQQDIYALWDMTN